MIEHSGKPDPELLAAYLDGEFEGRDGIDDLRRRVEAWLESDPLARDLARDYRHLRRVWSASRPQAPPSEIWATILDRVRRPTTASSKTNPRGGRPLVKRAVVRLVLAGLACVVAAGLLAVVFRTPAPGGAVAGSAAPRDDEGEVLAVASADEVVILQVEGGDTSTLVVGQLPVQGPLELVAPGDVVITSIQPADDEMVPYILVGARSPLIWAPGRSE